MDYTKAFETIKNLEQFTAARDQLAAQVADLDFKIDALQEDLRSVITPYAPPTRRVVKRAARGATREAVIAKAREIGTLTAESIFSITGKPAAAATLSKLTRDGVLSRIGVGQYVVSNNQQ